MCGICGIVDFEVAPSRAVVERMTKSLYPRGPDDRGVEAYGPATLGQSRLSIIDLTATGHQPMAAIEDSVALTFNGEIYNYRELRSQLQSHGYRFRGSSDTEVLLNGYCHWGLGVFDQLRGMFAVAIWDGRTETLHLARDPFGIKPLYLAEGRNRVVFGSEPKALLRSDRVARRISSQGLVEYMWFGYTLGDSTLFSGIRKVRPGHVVSVSRSGVEQTRFWRPEELPTRANVDAADATATIRRLLIRAVDRHLVSDVPVGAFLSGGIDSSAITLIATRELGLPLRTFSAAFDFARARNELPAARRVADLAGTVHHELFIRGENVRDVIEALVLAHDEPFADAANIPLFLLCAELGGDPKVILQGDGGDEIFAGYRRYNALSILPFWRALGRVMVPASILSRIGVRGRRLHRFLAAMSESDAGERMALLLTQETRSAPPTWILSPTLQQQLASMDPFAEYRRVSDRISDADPVQQMLLTDTQILLPNSFLEKVDRATMANSIEVRVPFLDLDLAEYALSLPSRLKVRWGQKKWILRRALRGIVPNDILDAPKRGFGVPYKEWLRNPLRDYMTDVLLDASTVQAGIFERRQLERTIQEHIDGRADHGFLLWKALQLALWHTLVLRGES